MTLGLTNWEINHMMRGIKRYHFAAKQDRHPVVAFLHNAYSVAIMDEMRDMATDAEIDAATGERIQTIRKEILELQDKLQKAAEKLAKKLGAERMAGMMGAPMSSRQAKSLINLHYDYVRAGWHPAVIGRAIDRAVRRRGSAGGAGLSKAARTRRLTRTPALGPRPRVAGERCIRFSAGPGQEAQVLAQINALRSQGWNIMESPPGGGWPAHPTYWACPPGHTPRESQTAPFRSAPFGAPLYAGEF